MMHLTQESDGTPLDAEEDEEDEDTQAFADLDDEDEDADVGLLVVVFRGVQGWLITAEVSFAPQ